jgi:hypothetical protein
VVTGGEGRTTNVDRSWTTKAEGKRDGFFITLDRRRKIPDVKEDHGVDL